MKKSRGIINSSSNAITLIALIITIIILLILAGISISALTNTELFSKAKEAKLETEIATEKEQVQLAYLDAKMENLGERITEEQLQESLDKTVGEDKTKAIEDNESFFIKFKESGRYYEINDSGNIAEPVDVKEDNTPGILTGSGTEEEPYIIMSIEDLVVFSNMANGTGIKLNEDGSTEDITATNTFSNKYVILGKTLNFKSKLSYVDYTRKDFGDINNDGVVEDLLQELTTGTGFKPIASFKGIFDGQNNELEEIYMYRSGNATLFLAPFTIKNLGVTGNITSTNANAAGICTFSTNKENCWNKATITGKSYAAGINSGYAGAKAKNCYNEGNISGSWAGGIAARMGSNSRRLL